MGNGGDRSLTSLPRDEARASIDRVLADVGIAPVDTVLKTAAAGDFILSIRFYTYWLFLLFCSSISSIFPTKYLDFLGLKNQFPVVDKFKTAAENSYSLTK